MARIPPDRVNVERRKRPRWRTPLLIVIVASAAVLLILRWQDSMTPPGELGQRAATIGFQLPIEPRTLASWMNQPGASTPIYRGLDAFLLANQLELEAFAAAPSLSSPQLDLVQKTAQFLVQADSLKEGGVFQGSPAQAIGYSIPPALQRLELAQDVCLRLAALQEAEAREDPAKPSTTKGAQDIYRGLFSLAVKLHEERYSLAEWERAAALFPVVRNITEIDTEQRTAFANTNAAYERSIFEPVLVAIKSVEPQPGDMAALADHAGDRLWRVEAILALGRVRYTSPRRPDREGAEEILTGLSKNSDPVIQAAAKAALQLTREELGHLK